MNPRHALADSLAPARLGFQGGRIISEPKVSSCLLNSPGRPGTYQAHLVQASTQLFPGSADGSWIRDVRSLCWKSSGGSCH